MEITPHEYDSLKRKADKHDDDATIVKWIIRIVIVTALVIIAFIFAWKAVTPQLNLYRANTEKKAVIAEQRAISEAAEFAARSSVIQAQAKADAEVIRAEGLAASQEIISATLTEEYLRYLYINQLDEPAGQVIYIPTEAGLPILEAERLAVEP
jgi:predicted Holliday junction resolvase-like endonuclease